MAISQVWVTCSPHRPVNLLLKLTGQKQQHGSERCSRGNMVGGLRSPLKFWEFIYQKKRYFWKRENKDDHSNYTMKLLTGKGPFTASKVSE